MSKQTNEPSGGVDLDKDLDERPAVKRPKSIDVVLGAVAAAAVLSLVHGLLLRGYTNELVALLKKSNADAKKPKSPYGTSQALHDLSQVRSSALIQAIILIVILGALGYMLTRHRTASASRWGLIAILVLMRIPFAVIPAKDMPGLPQVAGVLMGIASIVVIVGLLVPPSMQYFRDARDMSRPAGAPPRPGLGSLFAPRQPRQPRPSARDRRLAAPAEHEVEAAPASTPAAPRRGKAKVRADEAAVARGAELARSRAKASKSRRSE